VAGGYRKEHSEDLHNLYSTINTIRIINRRLRREMGR
jgi:hypothetical protein